MEIDSWLRGTWTVDCATRSNSDHSQERWLGHIGMVKNNRAVTRFNHAGESTESTNHESDAMLRFGV